MALGGGGDLLSRRFAKLALLWPHLSLLPCLLMSPVPAWSGLEARGMGHTLLSESEIIFFKIFYADKVDCGSFHN